MKFDTMDKAIEYLLESTPGGEVFYRSDLYSVVTSDTCKMTARYDKEEHGKFMVTGRTWNKNRNPAEPYHPFSRKEIGRLAFIKLRSEKKYEAALSLANSLLNNKSFTLGLGDTDWEIQDALRHCGYEPVTVSRHRATMSLEGTVKLPDHIYNRLQIEFYD